MCLQVYGAKTWNSTRANLEARLIDKKLGLSNSPRRDRPESNFRIFSRILASSPFVLRAEVRGTSRPRPNYLQELTFKIQCLLFEFPSAVPPCAGAQDGGADSPKVTRRRHSAT